MHLVRGGNLDTPTSTSCLNLVECFFSTPTEKRLRRGAFTSVGHLEQCLKDYLDTYNDDPKPLVWTKVSRRDHRESRPGSAGHGRR